MKKPGTISPAEALVLIVDDEEEIRSVLARHLTLLEYQVHQAASGQEALDMLRCACYDVAVLDIRLPDIDGVEVMYRARQIRPDLTIIFLTGHASLESAIAAVRSGAVDYLLKPAGIRDLAAAIDKALQRRAQVGQLRMQTVEPDRFMEVGIVTLDRQRRTMTVAEGGAGDGTSAKLTTNETALLAYFMQHPGIALSCRELAHAALGYSVSDKEAATIIRPHVSRLRKKIEINPRRPRLILSAPHSCYLFDPQFTALPETRQ
jgi:DNA-binding response OmpR family regulator